MKDPHPAGWGIDGEEARMKHDNNSTTTRGATPTTNPARAVRLNKRVVLATICAVCLLAIVGVSKPGRSALRSILSLIEPAPTATPAPDPTPAAVTPAPDVEQRARARHGWTSTVVNSVVRGTITYLNADGTASAPASGFTLYRKYPELLRIEVDRGGRVEVSGFDNVKAWRTGATLSEEEARNIRGLLRLWPERLFITRGSGTAYREAGRRIEDTPDTTPGGQPQARSVALFDQIEMEDVVGPAPTSGRVGDRRSVYYYVNQASSTVEAIRWLEPADPRRSIDEEVGLIDVRVDFGTGAKWAACCGLMP